MSVFFALRLFYYPIHLFFVWPKARGHLYTKHPVAWDDMCVLPFPGLDRILIDHAEKTFSGRQEIERLITNYPSQRTAALRAKAILLTREAGQVNDLAMLEDIAMQLPDGKKGFFLQIPRLREMLHEISSLQARLNTMNRPVFREPLVQSLCKAIEIFQYRIDGFHESLAIELRTATILWLEIAERQLRDAKVILDKEPSFQVFRAGDPVDCEKEAFVPRYNILEELEKQIMSSTGCPGLILYGRRRIGKSTILRNLSGFLPDTVSSALISMQDPRAFTSVYAFSIHLAQKIKNIFVDVMQLHELPADLPGLFRLLSNCNVLLENTNKRLLLALDEYENIDVKIGENIFPKDLLLTFRESIQSHRHLTWIFSGSHEITELTHAQWPSYLVSARTIEVPLFTPAETRLLLTEPMKFSTLWPKDDPKRPRFAPEFWGENGIDRIQHEAGGWPHLVQLIAETIVDLINDETKRQVDAELFERSLKKAIVSGHNVLYQLLRGESTLPGEWDYLAAFRKRETQPSPEDEAIYTSLRRRLLVEEENGLWRLRVPLMARWLKARG